MTLKAISSFQLFELFLNPISWKYSIYSLRRKHQYPRNGTTL